MESFVQLAETRNFSRAAKRLGIDASSLSRRIQSLEQMLGCTLVQRSPRSVTLTEQGKQVLARAEHILRDATALKDELARSSKEVVGQLRVGAPLDLCTTVIGPVLANFCSAQERITLELVATQGQPDLSADQLDVAFVIVHQRPLPDSAHTLHRIGTFRRLLFASLKYLEGRGVPTSVKDLQQHDFIRHLDQKPETAWELRTGSKRTTVAVAGVYATNSLANAAQAAQQGLGIALLPAYFSNAGLNTSAGLTRVLPEWEGSPAMVFAITARDHRLARITAMLAWAKTRVPEQMLRLDVPT